MNLLASPFPRRSSVRASRPMRNRVAVERRGVADRASTRSAAGLGTVEPLEQRNLLAILAAGVAQTSPDQFFTDFSKSMTSEYTSYSITNDASGPAADVWVKAVFPAGSVVGCGAGYNNEDGLYHVGTLAPNTTGTAFLYFTANSLSASPVPYALEVYDRAPAAGVLPVVTKPFSFTSVVNTIEASPNVINTVSFSPLTPHVGDTFDLTVTGYLGNGANRVLFAPASRTDWQPDVFELRSTAVTISGVSQPPDRLFYDGLTGLVNQQPFTADYFFLVTRTTTASTSILPTQFTQDGTQDYKHHRVGEAPFPPIPPVIPNLALTKDDGVTTYLPGGTTTYTITLSNTGLAPASGVTVADVLPSQFDPALTTWTVSYVNATGTLPLSGSGNIFGTVDLPALTGLVTITLHASIRSSALGDLTNTVSATLPGSPTITASDTDTAAPLANLVIEKSDGVTTVTAGGGTIQTYTIRVRNTGASDAQNVVVNDVWPAGFLQGVIGTPTQGNVTPGIGGFFAWSLGTLVAGTEATLAVAYTVPASTTPGTYTNTATVTSTTADSNPIDTATDDTAVVASANLSITKTNATDVVLAGGGTTQTYTITVVNNGASDARNVVVNDTWPAGFTQGAFGIPSQGNVTPGTGGDFAWSLGTLPAGGVATLTVKYTVAASAEPKVYTNTATVTSTTPDPAPENNTAIDTTTVTSSADLAIEKSDAITTVTAGGGTVQTYTITLRNLGASDARNVVVADSWPIGFLQGVFGVPSQGNVAPGSGGDFAWSVGTLAAGGVATLTVAYTVPASTTPGTYANTATVTSTTPDPVPANDTATDTTDVVASANLTITKDDGVTTVVAGDGTVRTYTLTVRNLGVSDARNVVVSDAWPAGFTRGAFGMPSQGNVVPGPGSDFTWSIGTLAPGGVATATVRYTVPASTLPGSVTNTATVSSTTPDPDPANTATDTNTVVTSADVAITKTDGLSTVTAGDGITHAYVITVTNLGPSDAQGVSVADVWPAGFTPAGFALPSQGNVTPGTGGNFTWSVGLLPAGNAATLIAYYTVPASTTPGDRIDTAVVSSGTPDPVSANNTATDTTTVIAMPDLSITKTDGVATVVAGGGTTQTYTLTIRNTGISDARGVVATDAWPAGFTQGTVGLPSQGTVVPGTGGDFTWNAGTLVAGGTATLTVTYTVAASVLPGPRTNTATVTSIDDPEPHVASDVTTVLTSADLVVFKTDSTTIATAGDRQMRTYLIRVRNAGVSDAQGAVLTDLWPTGFRRAAIETPSQGTVASDPGGDFTWTIGTLAAGAEATLAVSYVVPSRTLPGDYVNTVSVTSDTTDPDPNNNVTTDTTTVVTSADVTITKSDGVTSVLAGGGTTYTYTLTVRNLGVSDARDVAVADAWPAGFMRTALGTPSRGSVASAAGGDFTWTIGTLLEDGFATLTVSYVVPAGTLPGSYMNTATVTSSTPDPVDNNTATDTNTVTALANLLITKDDGVTTVVAGGGTIQTYTIRVTNTGASHARDVMVSDAWPAGFTPTMPPIPSQGTVTPGVGGSFAWSAGTIAAGASATVTATYIVPASTLPGPYVNTATVATSTPNANPVVTATDTTDVTALADLSITKTDGETSVVAGDGITHTYTLKVKNNGRGFSDAQGVVVTDVWPAGFTQGAFGIPSQGNVTPGTGGNFTWSLGTLAQGAEATLTVAYTVPAGATLGVYTNTATVASPTPDPDPNNTATDTTTVIAVADLWVTKVNGEAPYVPGTSVTYTITAHNSGPSTVLGTTVSDPLPSGTSFVSASGGATYDPVTRTVTFPVGTLATGGAQAFTLTILTDPDRRGILENTAIIAVPANVTDPNLSNNTFTDPAGENVVADLWVTKRNGDAPYVPGTSLTYMITARNAGPSTVFATTVSDPLPSGTTFASASGGATYDPVTRTVTFPVGRLAPGGSEAFALTVLTDPSRRGPLENTVTIAVPTDVTDPNLSNNTFTDPANDRPTVSLGVNKTDGKTTYIPGVSTTYTIVVTNSGPSALLGGSVSDPLPALASSGTWTSVASAGSSVTPATGAGSLAASINLLPGGTITFSYVVTIRPDATGPLVNTVTVTPPAGTTGSAVSATDTDVLGDVPALVLGTDDGCYLAPLVKIINPVTGALVRQFLAYETSFRGSVRVATGDVTGDGIAEIVVAPGRARIGEIRVFTQQGVELPKYRTLAFGSTYNGGVEVAVGDVDGDGTNDIIAGQSSGAGLVNVFKVTPAAADPVANVPIRSFRPFPSPYALGVSVAAGDFGTYSGGTKLSAAPDGRAEIVVGTNAGTRAQVRIYDASTVTPKLVRTILPFASTFTGGVTLSTGRWNTDSISDVVVGAGVNGNSTVEIYDGATGARLERLTAFAQFARPNAAVFAALLDYDGNGVADDVYGVQGRSATGGSPGVRRWNRVTTTSNTLPQSTGNQPPLRIASIILRSAS